MTSAASKDAVFAQVLREASCSTPAWQAKTLILGSIAATDMVSPGAVLKALWSGDGAGLETLGQGKEFVAHFFSVWNELADLQSDGHYRLWDVPREETWEAIERHIQVRQEEIKGFVKGLDMGASNSKEMLPEAITACEALAKADAFLDGFRRMTQKPSTPSQLADAWKMLTNMDHTIADSLVTVIREQKRLRGQQIRAGTYAPLRRTPTASAVGRNDPCPCGSGKKFKKCCGGV